MMRASKLLQSLVMAAAIWCLVTESRLIFGEQAAANVSSCLLNIGLIALGSAIEHVGQATVQPSFSRDRVVPAVNGFAKHM